MVSTEVAIRQVFEKAIVTAIVEDALKAGYWLKEDGTDMTNDKNEILDILFDLDEAYLSFIKIEIEDGDDVYTNEGGVQFVYGNEGWDVIRDWSLRIEPVLWRAFDIGNAIEEGRFSVVIHEQL